MSHPGRPPSRLGQAAPPPSNGGPTRPTTRSSTTPLAEIINSQDENVRDALSARNFLDKIQYTIPGEPMTAEHLSQALFYITQMKGITPTARSAIRSAAYPVQDLSASATAQAIIKDISSKLENSLVAAISPQVAKILSAADSLKDTNQKLESSIEGIPRSSGCVTDYGSQTDTTALDSQLQALVSNTTSIKEAIIDLKTMAKTQSPLTPSPYRDALLAQHHDTTTTAHLPVNPTSDLARAHAAIKERQILLDPDRDHPTINSDMKKEDLVKLLKNAVDTIETLESPKLQLKSITRLQNQGIVLEMNSREAANWIRNPTNRLTFIKELGGKIRIKDRLYHVVVPFFPISADITDASTMRDIERENDIPVNAIVTAKWVKDPTKRSRNQRVAHAIFALSTPEAANKILKDGLYVQMDRLRPHKDKKEPTRCLKCQRFGHLSRECAHHEDSCGTCAGNHRVTACTSPQTPRCVNCQTDSHSSSDRKCPEFLKRCKALDEHTPENNMPYFPTEEPWTQVLLPPRPTTALNPTIPPMPQHPAKPSTARTLRQTTLGEAMSIRNNTQERGAPRRLRGGHGGPPITQQRHPPPPSDPAPPLSPSTTLIHFTDEINTAEVNNPTLTTHD
ncbi:hypothetical protein PISMIDRAFT_17819 [Pisolithus microcarpus 441]|uniref:Unplaced genomic scaffold scaffold_297, whole genome shotgun sequence n=1 Tax=Pisolithus microcarpus 441 TaxID=765257 RepID=A0A0C9Y9V4_9AGAM|nr:hypothetical protein PISMIDRAFT_17819 [Pisolithus microcarpus 441]